jgi:hypothetical protein
MTDISTHPKRRGWLFVIFGMLSVCMVAAGSSALSNRLLPDYTREASRLGELDKSRLSEAWHVRAEPGEALWPGWGQADIPVILYNEEYAFLVGYPDPPAGWERVPDHKSLGTAWEMVPADTFNGTTYYRQRLANPAATPQSFTVLVGNRWVASLACRDWLEIGLGNEFKDQLPLFLRALLPYRLAGRLFLASTGGKDWYVLGIAHESFHAYEGLQDPSRLYAAENIFNQNMDRYPAEEQAFREDWQVELNLLVEAVQSSSQTGTMALVRQFLAERENRRSAAGLDADLVMLEKLKEWEEGLAKYTELSLWRLAATTPGYQPLPGMSNDPGFKNYTGYQGRWNQEIQQVKRMADAAGDQRFYYSGLAQAALLDRLVPDWRGRVFARGVFLEDLLKQAVK